MSRTIPKETARPRMNREVFGVFGSESDLSAHRSLREFDAVVSGRTTTVGVRDTALDLSGRTSVYEGPRGHCVLFGEACVRTAADANPARELYERFAERGLDAVEDLNGSYLAVLEYDDEAWIVPDLLRSWECFYTDTSGTRAFGTDAARVARTIDSPTVDRRGLNELLHFGVVFGMRTLLDDLERQPFDAALGSDRTEPLDRFVYDPSDESDIVENLARRLERAVEARDDYPGPKGLLASAGYDSRLLMSTISDLDACYTLGEESAPEVQVARKLAAQYGLDHETLPVTSQYLNTSPEIVQYTNGVRESLHIHHRGNDRHNAATTMYHGLFLDTLLRAFYLPRKTIDLLGHPLPVPGLEADPDPQAFYTDRLDVYDNDQQLLAGGVDDARTVDEFVTATIDPAIDRCAERANSTYNAMAMLGVKLTPALPFRTHLADNFVESLVAADDRLVEWHLTTPPEVRTSRTFQRAIKRIDGDIFRHRPPDRRYASRTFSQIDSFVRRTVPWLSSPGTPWPDRRQLYERHDMDSKLFPDTPRVHEHPPQIKLRLNDALTWLELATDRGYTPDDLLDHR